MDYKVEYSKWLKYADDNTKKEILAISDEKEVKERFYRNLEFGTGGLRGIMGAGSNRMNNYVIKKATKGLARYILKNENSGVVIAFDSRNNSEKFAKTAADTLTSLGIKVYLFNSLRPTPELSYAVRHLNATAGIVVTASHNPKEYNGYKIYWSDGAQISPDIAKSILAEIDSIDMFDKDLAANNKLLNIIGDAVDNDYINDVYKQAVNPDAVKNAADTFKLIYTPLHGSGNLPVRAILKKSRFKNIIIVKEQELPDGNFSTVKSPNPENKECFDIAIKLAEKNDVDLIIGTDPDCDRAGIVVRNKDGKYVTMTGNQVGVMLTNYILTAKKENCTLPKNGAVVSTIVSTRMVDTVCDFYGVKLFKTLTGFKFIGEKIHEFETNHDYKFLFGFEESYGYLSGTYCRDKDAVVASMLIAEMAAYYYGKGLTLFEVMEQLYKQFGGYAEELQSITLEGKDGMEKIATLMNSFRSDIKGKIGDFEINGIVDYNKDETGLIKSNVLKFSLNCGVDFYIRPSGTEPKIKLYYLSKAENFTLAKDKIQQVKKAVNELVK